MNISLNDIAQLIQGVVLGDGSIRVSSLSSIDEIIPGTLVFADGEDNIQRAQASEAAAILVNQEVSFIQKPLIQVEHPFKAFIQLLHYFNPPPVPQVGIHPTAVIAADVQLGEQVWVGPYVVIEEGSVIGNHCVLKSHIHIGKQVVIGEKTTIHPHVTVYDACHIGAKVTVHASSVIGSDGFGYTFVDGQHLKVPHCGRVVIEDEVEIGANSAIDRATLGATRIGEGTKIDNFVQVAHSVKLGKNNILCAFTGIAGSATLGNNVICAADVGVSDHVVIGDNVVLGARTGVPSRKHLNPNSVYLGNPARPKDKAIQHELSVTRIPFMRKQIQALTEQVALLKKKMNTNEVEPS
jgi:UDP-3-O-[3-hydroxymyristoyl] glucosamine N-acyltransferase